MNFLDLKPNSQSKLYNYERYFLNFVSLYNKKKLPNKIIFSGKKGIGKSTFAYHLINYIFSLNDEKYQYDISNFEINNKNKSYKLILNNAHTNFHLIDLLDEKKEIEISQIRNMYNFANKSSFNNKEKIILIDNAEYLNVNSSNALLKIMEEPNKNVFFILIYDNSKKILETLKSRCLKFNFYLSFNESIDITNKIVGGNLYNIVSKKLINHYNSTGDLINYIKLSHLLQLDISEIDLKNLLINIIDKKYYKNNFYIKNQIYNYIDFYFINLLNYTKAKKKIYIFYDYFIKKIYYLKKFNLDDESFFIELKTKILNG